MDVIERLRRIERERGSPDPLRFVRPGHGHGVVAADDRNGTGPHGGEIERHRDGGRLQRHETERGEQHEMHDVPARGGYEIARLDANVRKVR